MREHVTVGGRERKMEPPKCFEDYDSIRKFKAAGVRAQGKKPYDRSTWVKYRGRVERTCQHFNMSPDEFVIEARGRAREILEGTDEWRRGLKEQEHTTVHDWLITLRMFLKANGVNVGMPARYLRERAL